MISQASIPYLINTNMDMRDIIDTVEQLREFQDTEQSAGKPARGVVFIYLRYGTDESGETDDEVRVIPFSPRQWKALQGDPKEKVLYREWGRAMAIYVRARNRGMANDILSHYLSAHGLDPQQFPDWF
jgi:hypothetical protein